MIDSDPLVFPHIDVARRGARVGFTGTQHGMSDFQKIVLRDLLVNYADELHHGDCLGADAEADEIARELGVSVVIHPPTDPKKRAFCAKPGDVVWQPLPYIERNRDIVDATTMLIAAPRTDERVVRSGTWATVRYAEVVGRPVMMLLR